MWNTIAAIARPLLRSQLLNQIPSSLKAFSFNGLASATTNVTQKWVWIVTMLEAWPDVVKKADILFWTRQVCPWPVFMVFINKSIYHFAQPLPMQIQYTYVYYREKYENYTMAHRLVDCRVSKRSSWQICFLSNVNIRNISGFCCQLHCGFQTYSA